MTNKIRPPTHSSLQPSPKNIREEAESDLRETVRMPDPGARAEVDGAVDAGVSPIHRIMGGGELALDASSPSPPPGASWPERPPGAFTPDDALELRRHQSDPNRLGRPRQNTTAEQLLIEYQQALKAFRDDYAGTRSTRLERPFHEAKQRMIDAGLMKGDV